ncbi:tensin-2-like [Eriocheir sinensis]|uniref:tensin-2-like n=1 Tax=Eriocheir sinensis TaxID=95602 RepID=UPI0021C7290A|nr:tensin-2-like [Eriocheir sinensis]
MLGGWMECCPSTVETQRHVFKVKKVKKARPCQVCHTPVVKVGSCCRVCKYLVHKACEPKVSTLTLVLRCCCYLSVGLVRQC